MAKVKQDTLKQLRADMENNVIKLQRQLMDTQGQLMGIQAVVHQMGPPYISPVIDNSNAPYVVSQSYTINRDLAPHELLSPDEIRAGVTRLPDGTKQFPNAPTGPVVEHPPASTPAVPKEYGVGAVVRRVGSIETDTVWQVGNGVIRLRVPGGVQEWYYPRDVTLVTAAP